MADIGLTVIALALCCVLLWLRVKAVARSVHFRVFRGVVHAPGGIGALVADPVSGSLVARVKRFTLRGPGFDLGDLSTDDTALAVAAGHTISAVYGERGVRTPQPALLFNHDTARWRAVPGAWLSLRGDAASHFLPALGFFVAIVVVWMGAAAGVAPTHPELPVIGGVDPLLIMLAGVAIALSTLVMLAIVALRALDDELERRSVKALRNALFALPEEDRARRAFLNLAAPRTRRAPRTPDLIAI
jgi:hypothetical protein